MSDEEDDHRPSFGGGLGFRRAAPTGGGDSDDDDGPRTSFRGGGGLNFRPPTSFTQSTAPEAEVAGFRSTPLSDRETSASPPPAKKMRFTQSQGGGGGGGNNGASKPAGKGSGGFAARMMAKMGYKEGVGLGRDGHGRLAPIDAQLRPQGAGLGAVREKTKQAKQEERRAAALRGETVVEDEDSEQEEKRRRKEARKRRNEMGLSGVGAAGSRQGKTRYRTAAEIEAEIGGLQVPNVLKHIVDLNGEETTYVGTGQGMMVREETEAVKLARRARRDLEALAEELAEAKEMEVALELEKIELVAELDKMEADAEHVRKIVSAVDELEQLSLGKTMDEGDFSAANGADEALDERWEALTTKLEAIEADFADNLVDLGVHEIAVAAIHPMFKASMIDWDPLEKPAFLVAYLTRLQHILGVDVAQQQQQESRAVAHRNQNIPSIRPSKRSTTHYETLLHTLWLPKIRSALTNTWDVENPSPAEGLLDAWRPILPPFIRSHVMRQLIIPRLELMLSSWKPSAGGRKSRASPPHHWLLPWLEHLPASHLSPTSASGLAVTLKRKMRLLLSTLPLEAGIPTWLTALRSPLLPDRTITEIAVSTLLPRLSADLQENFVVDPGDQDVEPLERALRFKDLFAPAAFAELLARRVLPPLLDTLHQWLVAAPDHAEIEEWLAWWRDDFLPPELSHAPSVDVLWRVARAMIDEAHSLGDEARARLPPVRAFMPRDELGDKKRGKGEKRNGAEEREREKRRQAQPVEQDVTFRDIVEMFCEENALLFVPLREAHPTNGAPLFRITASETGKGGIVAYVHGDMMYVRKRRVGGDGRETTTWKATGLDVGLVKMAGG